jgi:hypothetical protein
LGCMLRSVGKRRKLGQKKKQKKVFEGVDVVTH